MRYTIEDLKHAKRLGIQEGIEQAQGVVLDMDRKLIDNMRLCIELDKSDSAEYYRDIERFVWMIYQDLIVLGDKVK